MSVTGEAPGRAPLSSGPGSAEQRGDRFDNEHDGDDRQGGGHDDRGAPFVGTLVVRLAPFGAEPSDQHR
jgi:hypothetical protein